MFPRCSHCATVTHTLLRIKVSSACWDGDSSLCVLVPRKRIPSAHMGTMTHKSVGLLLCLLGETSGFGNSLSCVTIGKRVTSSHMMLGIVNSNGLSVSQGLAFYHNIM